MHGALDVTNVNLPRSVVDPNVPSHIRELDLAGRIVDEHRAVDAVHENGSGRVVDTELTGAGHLHGARRVVEVHGHVQGNLHSNVDTRIAVPPPRAIGVVGGENDLVVHPFEGEAEIVEIAGLRCAGPSHRLDLPEPGLALHGQCSGAGL